jgi:DNA-directed RNA polymerase specialized sigma24 family protein
MQEIGDDDSPGSEESADNLVSEFQQDQLLREALSELPPRCRRLVQMLFFETGAPIF